MTYLKLKGILMAALLVFVANVGRAAVDYKQDADYLALRDSLHHAFNDGDSARFFVAVGNLEDYLLGKGDLHAYYTQRCNEIVFHLNRQNIIEAYKLATKLSHELHERKLDKEMYMAVNMMGHIYNYCGNEESAKRCFWDVIKRMEKEGYRESMPPIYMNLVNILMDEDPQEAMRLLDKAVEISEKYSPERLFDIEARRTLCYYKTGDMAKFREGYKAYKEGVAQGKSSVHGESLDIYYLALQGNVDAAVKMAMEELGNADRYGTVAEICENAGRWEEAYRALRQEMTASDSLNSYILSNNMEGIKDELRLYDTERQLARNRIIALAAVAGLLALLLVALVAFVYYRRRHEKELKTAYEHALESDRLKTAFIRNVSHEIRTPLNVISGFAQLLTDGDLVKDEQERKGMADAMVKNSNQIITIIDEMLELSINESTGMAERTDVVKCNKVLQEVLNDFSGDVQGDVTLKFESTLPGDFTLATHERMLRRMVAALVDNAVKNTEQGTVTLRATADDENLTVVVEDTGQGIPQEESEHIFDRFVKLDTFKEGLGLGLPLCRAIALRLGGSVSYDGSYAGPGARFVVLLPIQTET